MKEEINVIPSGIAAGEPTISLAMMVERVEDKPKPPWHRRFKDQNWKAAKFLSKEAIREAIVEFIKWWFFGRRRQPAQA